MRSQDATTRPACAVWCAPGSEPPAGLLAALEAKGLQAEPARDAYTALARVLRANAEGRVSVLVAVQPDALARFDEVLDTLDRFAPRIARWTFRPGDTPPLQIAERATAAASRAAPEGREQPELERPSRPEAPQNGSTHESGGSESRSIRVGGPMLRLTGLDALDADAPNPDGPEASALTSEELAALLGDDDPSIHRDTEHGNRPVRDDSQGTDR